MTAEAGFEKGSSSKDCWTIDRRWLLRILLRLVLHLHWSEWWRARVIESIADIFAHTLDGRWLMEEAR